MFARDGSISENIDCQIINTMLTIKIIMLNRFLLFLYKSLISFNLFIMFHLFYYMNYLELGYCLLKG